MNVPLSVEEFFGCPILEHANEGPLLQASDNDDDELAVSDGTKAFDWCAKTYQAPHANLRARIANSRKSAAKRRTLRLGVWDRKDYEWGEMLVRHYVHRNLQMSLNIDASRRKEPFATQDSPSNGKTIPKILHFIWLGSKPVPLAFSKDQCKQRENVLLTASSAGLLRPPRENCVVDPIVPKTPKSNLRVVQINPMMKSWVKHHPASNGWTHVVWTDEDVLGLNPPLVNYDAYCSNQENDYGRKSDILRYEILHRYGGLYVDVDYVCLSAVDLYHSTFEFYCGASNSSCVELNNGVLGSFPGHPVLYALIEGIQHWWTRRRNIRKEKKTWNPTEFSGNFGLHDSDGSSHSVFSDMMSSFLDASSIMSLTIAQNKECQGPSGIDAKETIEFTGPGLLTRTMCRLLRKSYESRDSFSLEPLSLGGKKTFRSNNADHDLSSVAVFPSHVFHPLPNTIRLSSFDALTCWEKVEEVCNVYASGGAKTKAVHLWCCSWQHK